MGRGREPGRTVNVSRKSPASLHIMLPEGSYCSSGTKQGTHALGSAQSPNAVSNHSTHSGLDTPTRTQRLSGQVRTQGPALRCLQGPT